MKRSILILVFATGLMLTAKPVGADDSAAPGAGFPASRYETLWTKSPFSVATAEAAQESPDYSLVGIAQFDGVSYASLIERQNQEHFLISTDKPTRGITLSSITRGKDGSDTTAIVQKDGQPLTLKLEQAPVVPMAVMNPGMPPVPNIQMPMPGVVAPQIPMPGSGGPPTTPSTRPMIRFHRSPIHLPPPPAQQQTQQPVQAHPATPPPQ